MTTSQDVVAGFEILEGDRLKIARERRHLSQTELALMSRVSRGTIQNYEGGARVKPGSRKLLADALGVAEVWLEKGVTVPFTDPGQTVATGLSKGNTGRTYGRTPGVHEVQDPAALRGNRTLRVVPKAA